MTALVIGATGLVGTQLVQQLLAHNSFSHIKILVRRSARLKHDKLEEQVVDFDKIENWKQLLTGDVLFSAMGTTLKKSGSKEAQYTIDYTYQFHTAEAAAANGVSRYVLVSASGSSLKSPFFYSRMKAELERDVQALSFQHIGILRPGLLAGSRTESRTGERFAIRAAELLYRLPGLSGLKPIQGADVAKAMIRIALEQKETLRFYPMKQLFLLSK